MREARKSTLENILSPICSEEKQINRASLTSENTINNMKQLFSTISTIGVLLNQSIKLCERKSNAKMRQIGNVSWAEETICETAVVVACLARGGGI